MTSFLTLPAGTQRETEQGGAPRVAPWNAPGVLGVVLSAGLPLLATLLLNGFIFATGMRSDDPAITNIAWAPPGWVVGLIWSLIFPMWGLARWLSWRSGSAGQIAARWIVVLMAWSLAYPFLTLGFQVELGAIMNGLSLLLGLFVMLQVWTRAPNAAAWIVPSLLWMCFANVLGLAAVLER